MSITDLENRIQIIDKHIKQIHEMIDLLRGTNNPTYHKTIEGLIYAGNDFILAKYDIIDEHEELKHHANAVLMQVLKEQKQRGHK